MLRPELVFRLILFVLLVGVAATRVPLATEPASAEVASTTIAYVRPNDTAGDEIRLIEAAGSGDRRIWSTNKLGAEGIDDISHLVWRPDGSELAFASRHEAACSFYESDIYAMRPDGSGYRRVTAPPACGQHAGFATGTVRVTLENRTDRWHPFVVYFEGAPGPQSISTPPYTSGTVTFTDVADYGNQVQWAVAVHGEERYHSVSGNADVQPGAVVETRFTMWGPVLDWGWRWPTWRSDGSRIAYVFGSGDIYHISAANTTPGETGDKLLATGPIDDGYPLEPKHLAWGPASRANELLYSAYDWDYGMTIFHVMEGSSTPGERLVPVGGGTGETVLGLAWLPDGSGFLYSATEEFGGRGNLYQYTFATNSSTRLTNFTEGFSRRVSVSPDGQQVVFERHHASDWLDTDAPMDLWIMNPDGSGQQLLVQNGRAPAWRPPTVSPPPGAEYSVYLPALTGGE